MADQLHVVISGLVQGVGFRHATYRKALELGLRGWVRNLPDGTVEAVFQGDRAALDHMRSWCRHGPGLSRVDNVAEEWQSARDDQGDFRIVF